MASLISCGPRFSSMSSSITCCFRAPTVSGCQNGSRTSRRSDTSRRRALQGAPSGLPALSIKLMASEGAQLTHADCWLSVLPACNMLVLMRRRGAPQSESMLFAGVCGTLRGVGVPHLEPCIVPVLCAVTAAPSPPGQRSVRLRQVGGHRPPWPSSSPPAAAQRVTMSGGAVAVK